jgi:ABC-2 type transport system ATP-binding protein
LIGGLLLPTRGDVFVQGLSTFDRRTRILARVGYVVNEERSFYWRLTGMENLRFFAALENVFGRDFEQRAERLLAAVGIWDARHRPVSDY